MVATTASHPYDAQQEGRINTHHADIYRICIVSDDLSGVPDEGVKKFTLALATALDETCEVVVISTKGPSSYQGVACIPTPRTFLSHRLRVAIAQQDPDILVYAARGSATFFSFLRSRILRLYCSRAKVVLLGLQTRWHSWPQKQMIRHLRPDLVCVQSGANRDYLEALGCKVELLSSGVDIDTFQPVDPERRRTLRESYGMEPNVPVVLHVGHLTSGRRIHVLAELAAQKTCQVVLVASSSTEQETALGQELREAGVKVLTEYQPHIEHLYQLADCYVFPVESTNNAIEAPLSVLEALACGLPVVTTRFGGLTRMFPGQVDRISDGLAFVDSDEELFEETLRMCLRKPKGARDLALPYSWNSIATALIERILAEYAVGTASG